MPRTSGFVSEAPDRAVQMVLEHAEEHASQLAAIRSITEKIGCAAETLRHRVRQGQRNAGRQPVLTTDEHARLQQLERETFELRRRSS